MSDGDDQPDFLAVPAAYALFVEDGASYGLRDNELVINYYDARNDEPPAPSEYFKGYIPVGKQYASATEVPWNDVMKDIKNVLLSEFLSL